MSTLGNLIWFVCGGWLGGLLWWIAAVVMHSTVIGIPYGVACHRIARFAAKASRGAPNRFAVLMAAGTEVGNGNASCVPKTASAGPRP